MQIDLSEPAVQVAVIAGLMSLGGVLLAALAGFGGAILGARIGANAAKETARISQAESRAARDETRQAEERRHAREVEQWHREKGVAAAEAILDMLIELDLGLFSFWQQMQTRTKPTDPVREPDPSQSQLEPYYSRIKRHALAIKDEKVRRIMGDVVNVIYGYDAIETWTSHSVSKIWWQVRVDAEEVLGAYIRGEPIPDAKNSRELNEALREYHEETSG